MCEMQGHVLFPRQPQTTASRNRKKDLSPQMIAAFLYCALSLPSSHFKQAPINTHMINLQEARYILEEEDKPNKTRNELLRIRDAIQKIHLGAQVTITPPHISQKPGIDWIRWPFTWRDMWIWYKPKTEYDNPRDRRNFEASA